MRRPSRLCARHPWTRVVTRLSHPDPELFPNLALRRLMPAPGESYVIEAMVAFLVEACAPTVTSP